MIHQHILAAPRPGLSEEAFQDYWRYQHALKYARKIPQVTQYKIGSRMSIEGQEKEINYSGIAEVWLESDKAQAESLKSPEYLNGALRDEPTWAASWQTLVIDTDAKETLGKDISDRDFPEYKLLLCLKKRRDLDLEEFRSRYIKDHANKIKDAKIPQLTRVLHCLTRERFYSSEMQAPAFDAITHLSTKSRDDLQDMLISKEFQELLNPELEGLSEWWGVVSLAVRSEWIVGPPND